MNGLRSGRLVRDRAGFTLSELIVAAALVVIVGSAVAALASPMRRAFDSSLSAGEAASRGRTALQAIISEFQNAGGGVIIGPTTVTLEDVIPAVMVVSPSTVAMTRASGPQGLLREHVDAGAISLRIDHSQPCSEQDPTCGIRAGNTVAIFDGAKGETAGISSVDNGAGTLHLTSPLKNAFDPGAAIASIEQRIFTVSNGQLVRITPGGAEQPLADRVRFFTASIAAGRLDLHVTLEPATAAGRPFDLRTSVAFRK